MKTLAIIPARSGSKGFKNKNIAKIGNKTLIEIAVELAKKSDFITDVYISTDSRLYEDVAVKAGAKTLGLRSAELSSDTAKTTDVVMDMLKKIDTHYDYIMLLQPTSPIRGLKDIENIFHIMKNDDVKACVSVTLFEEPHPFKLKSVDNEGKISPFIENTTSEVPRQILPKAYALNGALYVVKTAEFKKTGSFFPEQTRAYIMNSHFNIDSEFDYMVLNNAYQINQIPQDIKELIAS